MSQHKTKGQLHSELVHKAVLEVIETEQNWTSDHKFSIKQCLKQQQEQKTVFRTVALSTLQKHVQLTKKKEKIQSWERPTTFTPSQELEILQKVCLL